MNLTQKIFLLYPSITLEDFNPFTGTIALQDDSDGKGQYIAKWDRPEPQPTQEQLQQLDEIQ